MRQTSWPIAEDKSTGPRIECIVRIVRIVRRAGIERIERIERIVRMGSWVLAKICPNVEVV